MPSTAEGLSEGGTAVDSFEAALEAKGIEGGGKSGTLSVAESIIEASAPGPTPVVDTPAAVTTPTEGEATPLHEDPEVAALLAKYDGDPDKALKAAVELQRKLGEQGNELGQLRQTVAKLEGAVEQINRAPVQQQAAVQMSGEQLDEAIGEYGGFETAKWAANNAPHLVASVLQKWAAEGPEESFLATRFDREYQTYLANQEAASKDATPSKADEYVAKQEATDLMTAVLTDVAGEFEDYEAFKAYVPAALEAVPKHLAAAIVSDDVEVKTEAVKDLYERAQRLAAADAGKDAAAAAAAKATAGKTAARVIQGQGGSPATPTTPAGEAKSREEQEAAFKASILAADTTSVQDGLTYGNK